jgi:hypothetical protein
MDEAPLVSFYAAIKAAHGATARFVRVVRVEEDFEGKRLWIGLVRVFDLLDHPTATRCYAWESAGVFTVVLHEWPVDSPQAAVRASLASPE